MDFKVAGTREFVTALQLDTKLDGIPAEVLAVGADPGQRRPARDPRRDGRGHRRARGDVGARTAHHHDPGPRRQDRRGHRPEGQDHQPDPGRHRRHALDRGRRHGLHRCDQRRGGRGRQRRGQRDRQPDDARGRRALPRHRRQDDQLRCVRLADARQGRPAAHQQAARAWPAASGSTPSRTSSRSARRSRSRSPRSTTAASCRWSRSSRTPRLPTRPRARTTPSDHQLHRTDDRPAGFCWPVVRSPEDRQHRTVETVRDADGQVTSRVRRTVLPGGLRVITEQMAGVRSASIGVWVGVGSRDETPTLHGCSHFLEHLLFKGTRGALGAGHLGRPRRGRRRVQRLHREGVHLLPRAGARRGPAARGRRARRHDHRLADRRRGRGGRARRDPRRDRDARRRPRRRRPQPLRRAGLGRRAARPPDRRHRWSRSRR